MEDFESTVCYLSSVFEADRRDFHYFCAMTSIFSSNGFQMDKTMVSVAAEQSRHKANMVAHGDGKFGPWGRPQNPSKI